MITIKRKGAAERRSTPRSKGEDFVPWVSGEHKDFQDLEEEEREERMTGLLDRYAPRKRKLRLSSSNESDPVQTAGPSQAAVEGGSEMQAIFIPGSPEPVPTDQTEPTGVDFVESHDADPIPSALLVIPPSDRDGGQLSRSKFMRSGLPRPPLPERIITNYYAPSRGPDPSRMEVSAPGADEVKYIMRCWETFHHGEAAADRLVNLYPHMLRMPIATRGMGLGEDYSVSVPIGTGRKTLSGLLITGYKSVTVTMFSQLNW